MRQGRRAAGAEARNEAGADAEKEAEMGAEAERGRRQQAGTCSCSLCRSGEPLFGLGARSRSGWLGLPLPRGEREPGSAACEARARPGRLLSAQRGGRGCRACWIGGDGLARGSQTAVCGASSGWPGRGAGGGGVGRQRGSGVCAAIERATYVNIHDFARAGERFEGVAGGGDEEGGQESGRGVQRGREESANAPVSAPRSHT